MSSAFSIDFLEPNSEFQTPVTFLLVDKNIKVWVFIFLVRSQGKFWLLNCQDLLKFSLFLLLLLWFQFGPHNVQMCMMSFTTQKSVTLKIVYNKKKIQMFGMNMPFISSREARKCIFHSWLRHS